MEVKKTKRVETIGERIRKVRWLKGCTASEIAYFAEVSPTVIYHTENKGGVPRADTLGKIARYLGVSTDYLIYGDDYSENGLKDAYIINLREQANKSEKEFRVELLNEKFGEGK